MAVLFTCWAPPTGAETRGLEHLAFGIRQILCLGEAHKEEGVSGVPTASAQSASLSTPHSPAQFPMLRHVHPRPLPRLSSGGVVEAGMCSCDGPGHRIQPLMMGQRGWAQHLCLGAGRGRQVHGVRDLGTLQAQEGPIVPTLGSRDRSRARLESQILLTR